MNKLIVLFNHALTEEQRRDAEKNLSVKSVVLPPQELSVLWADVPPYLEGLSDWLTPFKEWLSRVSSSGDYLLVQGDYGATWLMVNYAFELNLIPVYATTRREAKEVEVGDGVVEMRRRFAHVQFRRYGV